MLPRHLLATALLAAAGFSPATHAATSLRYSFDTDDQGWTAQAGGQLSYQTEASRHGGFLRIADVTSEDFVVVPPAAALGNWSSYLNGTLQFAARNANADTPDWPLFGQVTISSGDLSVLLDIAPDNSPEADGRWHRYSSTLTPDVWGPDLATVLANVTGFSIKLEFHAGVSEVVDFDNFRLRRAPR
jgi:hypothetical protein